MTGVQVACFTFRMETNHTAIRDRGYRVQRQFGQGTDEAHSAIRGRHAIVMNDDYFGGEIEQGEEVVIRGLSNAGFRGIEASVTLLDQDRHAVINLGNLDIVGLAI